MPKYPQAIVEWKAGLSARIAVERSLDDDDRRARTDHTPCEKSDEA
jgi:hypothetical protein